MLAGSPKAPSMFPIRETEETQKVDFSAYAFSNYHCCSKGIRDLVGQDVAVVLSCRALLMTQVSAKSLPSGR